MSNERCPGGKDILGQTFQRAACWPKGEVSLLNSNMLFKERPLITSNQALDVNLEELYLSFMKALELEVDFIVIFLSLFVGGRVSRSIFLNATLRTSQ